MQGDHNDKKKSDNNLDQVFNPTEKSVIPGRYVMRSDMSCWSDTGEMGNSGPQFGRLRHGDNRHLC